MSRLFYGKLALSNLRKNAKIYLPFLLTCIGTIMMFYMICVIVNDQGLNTMKGGESLKTILELGVYVIGLFAIVFLFYTNSFLIKRRKKEFGLLNILGMEKRHIATMMLFEHLYVAFFSLVIGLFGGILFSKLMFLVLLKILQFSVPFGFFISVDAIKDTLLLFGSIFILLHISAVIQVHLSKPVELMRGGQVGEREPKTKWLLVILGVLCLGSGYWLAVTTKEPREALLIFFVAVILVIAGTYFLFVAGSIAFLKLLRQNKGYYYQTNHFIAVSGMIYRMKHHAVGLANICILSTMVLVMVSGTVSLYLGMEDVLRTRYPRNITLSSENMSEDHMDDVRDVVMDVLNDHTLSPKQLVQYRYLTVFTVWGGQTFLSGQSAYMPSDTAIYLHFTLLDDYNRMTDQQLTLQDDELLIGLEQSPKETGTLHFFGINFKVKDEIAPFHLHESNAIVTPDRYSMVVKDMAVLDALQKAHANADGYSYTTSYLGFDLDANDATQMRVVDDLQHQIDLLDSYTYINAMVTSKESFFAMYGGLFFLGIFLGTLFMMATILIIYYKQISEGYDDRNRFEIMQKVGLTKAEVRKTIQSQVWIVFFAPLGMAIVHILFAFPVITKLLLILNLDNELLFALCTGGTIFIFAMLYWLVYQLTAKQYYLIVNEKS